VVFCLAQGNNKRCKCLDLNIICVSPQFQGGSGVLYYYNGSHAKALVKLYPELRLKKENFLKSKEGWKTPAIQRSFFEAFARSNNFNPLDAEKWYSVTCKEITRAGGRGALSYYNGSHIKALVMLYPELMLRKRNFFKSQKKRNARKFFDEFAKSKKFSPLDAEMWYSVTAKEILRAGGDKLLFEYNGSYIKALVKLFPELCLKKENFLKFKKKRKKLPPTEENFQELSHPGIHCTA